MASKVCTRRGFLKAAGIGAASVAAWRFGGAARLIAGVRKRPNIVFFFTDDQRFDTIRALGNEEIITPNMDALVRGGTTFTNAYIMGSMSGAVCMPSRAMLMSGRTLFHLEGQGRVIPEGHATMGEVLRKAGYVTFETGKWHQDAGTFSRSFSDGAKIFFGGMSDHYKVPVRDFDPTGKYPRQKIYRDEGVHSSELFSDAAIRFLRGHKEDKPFFLYIAYTAPHDPRDMPEQYLNMYDAEKVSLPRSFMAEHPFDNGEMKIRDEKLAAWPRTPEEIRRHKRAYYAMITHVDAQIGRVMEALKETGQAENTIIIFSGDNGLAVGRHGLMGKQNLYEHSVHVPLVFSGPGIGRNERRDGFCYLLDIFPTVCELTGLDVPDSVEGRSLAGAIGGRGRRLRRTLFFAYKDIQRGVRDRRFKLIEYFVNGKRTTQLFDLERDPFELENLAGSGEHRRNLVRLRKELVRWREELDDESKFWEGYEVSA
ncbi:MAG: sulfatase-like hydrolase/transferase [Phycisphaerales bacterium]|nr:MAG: sulfatase-like hydrolase/transferase [Phycisphaerales bacterium]